VHVGKTESADCIVALLISHEEYDVGMFHVSYPLVEIFFHLLVCCFAAGGGPAGWPHGCP
jgi:hypothetical protein